MNKSELFYLTESRCNFCDNNELEYNIFFQTVPCGARGKNADHEKSSSDEEEEEEVNASKERGSFQMVKLK